MTFVKGKRGRYKRPLTSATSNLLCFDNLYQWQKTAVGQLGESDGWVLSSQPGTGKTIVSLMAAGHRIVTGKTNRVLLVAPRPVLDTVWKQEAESWRETFPLTFDMAHQYTGLDRERLWFETRADFTTCTFGLLPVLLEAAVARKMVAWDLIIIDESHMVKSPQGEWSAVIRSFALSGASVWMLSGTPTPNGPIDAWMPGYVTSCGRDPFFGKNFNEWREKYFQRISRFGWRPRAGAEDLINKKLAKRASAISLEKSGADVPAAVETVYPFEWDKAHRERIEDFIDTSVVTWRYGERECDSDESFAQVYYQLTSGLVYEEAEQGVGRGYMLSDSRIEALKQIVIQSEGPVLVSVFFRCEVEAMLKAFPGSVCYTGKTPLAERPGIIERWNRDEIPVLFATPSSMGVGLNLQKGSAKTIVWHTNTFNYAARKQYNARLIRSGQKKVVSIIDLVSDIGFDQIMHEQVSRKHRSAEKLSDLLQIGQIRR